MMRKLLLAVAAAIAFFLIYVAFQPAYGTVMRTAVLAAPPEAIFPHINSLKNWNAWSPWAKLDPAAKAVFAGPETGPGAEFTWSGNRDVGTGKMTILESDPNKRVKINLDFQKPMASTSIAEFTLQPEGTGTRVTWVMSGERGYAARLVCALFNADRMVGNMFEKGLANLGAAASKP